MFWSFPEEEQALADAGLPSAFYTAGTVHDVISPEGEVTLLETPDPADAQDLCSLLPQA